jgi:RNA polymerase sigma factor (TIGR02999 family)
MDDPNTTEATQILARLSEGDRQSAERLLPIVYDELRGLADRYFRAQPADHTLQPTALVHEAFLRLVNQPDASWESRAHFLAVAAIAMRQILINHAEKRRTKKRGGDRRKLALDDANAPFAAPDIEILALNEALAELAKLDERKGRVVEMRFFGGLGHDEIAHVLGVSRTTVESDWRTARAWIAKRMTEAPGDDA